MNWVFLFIAGLLLSAIIAAFLGWIAYKRRKIPGATPFLFFAATAGIWALAQAFEVIAIDQSIKLFWAQVEYLGIAGIGVAWLIFTLDYTRQQRWISKWFLAILLVIPTITVILAWTNNWHHLLWTRITPNSNSAGFIYIFEHGAWYWVHTFYTYLTLLAGMSLLLWVIVRSPQLYRKQVGGLLAGIAVPIVYNIFYLLGISPMEGMDLTPVTFILAGAIFSFNIFYLRLFDLVPVARAVLVEHVVDGVVVLDSQNRVVDLNPAALELLQHSTEALLGQPADIVFATWPNLLERLYVSTDTQVEIEHSSQKNLDDLSLERRDALYQRDRITEGGGLRYYEVHITPLYDRTRISGRLLILRDITDRKLAEQGEHQQRALAEALRDTAIALSSTLDLNEIFDHILLNLTKVVQHDAATVMLMKDGIAKVVRHHGYNDRQPEEQLLDFGLPISETTNLRVMSETHRPYFITDTLDSPGWVAVPASRWVRSYAGAPIILQNQVVGFLNVVSAAPNHFTRADADRLMAFAEQAAAAINNARLYEDARQRANQMTLLYQVGLTITSGLDLEHVLFALLEQCRRVLPIETFDVILYDEGNDLLVHPLFYDQGQYLQVEPRRMSQTPCLTREIIQTSRTLYLPDILDPTIAQNHQIIHIGGSPVRSYVGVPLTTHQRVIGVISMQSYKVNAFTAEQIALFETIATQAAIAIENANLYQQVQQLATHDELTGLLNRRALFEQGNQLIAQATLLNQPLSVLFIDIDHFKEFNDLYSYAVGDQVLRTLSHTLSQHIRSGDIAGRYGGEELIVLLFNTPLDGAMQLAERLRQLVEECQVHTPHGNLTVTVSIGVNTLPDKTDRSMEDSPDHLAKLIDSASHPLKDAKHSGRNRVIAAEIVGSQNN